MDKKDKEAYRALVKEKHKVCNPSCSNVYRLMTYTYVYLKERRMKEKEARRAAREAKRHQQEESEDEEQEKDEVDIEQNDEESSEKEESITKRFEILFANKSFRQFYSF